MNKIYKKKGDGNSLNLDEKLKSYAKEKIQKPLRSLLSISKGSLAILTPLAAASLISADMNAQCGAGSFNPTGGSYSNGQLDVDGNGSPDFDFYISGMDLFIYPVGTMSLGITSSSGPLNMLSTGALIDGAGSYGNAYYSFPTSLSSGTASTAYVPVRNGVALGFIEINFDGVGGFDIDIGQTGTTIYPDPVFAGDCASLPIRLINFDAEVRNKDIALSWATAVELNNQGFEIQRSSDGETYYKIGWVNGAGTIGNRMDYSYTDHDVKTNVLYYYRLKQMDFDGKYEFSPVASAKINGGLDIEVGTVYPNPVSTSEINLEVISKGTNEVSYELLNAFGQKVAAQVQTITAGLNTISISTSDLPNGTYFLKINALNVSEYKKIIVQK